MRGKVKYHAAAGSFTVAKREQRILLAFLGTCVGVALYAAAGGVGGLFHTLLPELGLSMSSLPDLVDALPEGLFTASPDATFQEGVSS